MAISTVSLRALATLLFSVGVPAALAAQAPATLVVTNARIHTVDSLRPTAEAMVVTGARVTYVGTRDSAMRLVRRGTRVVDAGGATIVPGITDAHAHLLGLGLSLRTVDLVGTRSYDEVIARIAARAKTMPAGAWVIGRGWDQNDWPDTHFPTQETLSSAVPSHPVFVIRVDGHAGLANARALRIAGVTAATRDPAGGRLERDASGAPTGVLVDNAMSLVGSRVPPPSAAERRAMVLAAVKEANRWGLTGIHDAGVNRQTIDTYEQLARAGRFTLRDYVMVSGDSATLAHYFARGPQSALYGGRLWIRAVKVYMDGALGSRGASMLAPYSDDTTNSGLLISSRDLIDRIATAALAHGFQVNAHAIGDRANHEVLDAFEAALRNTPGVDHRFRVEHAQVISPFDIPRFAALGVIPSMQSSHQTSDMYWAEQRVGPERVKGAYAWRSLLATGVILPNGSDFPVEAVNPLISFHSAVSRQDAKNFPPGGWYPDQKMTREEALKSMTLWPAMAGFQERDLGTLAPGKYADFVILDQDIMTVPDERILDTKVVATYLGGRAVYQAPAAR